MAHTGHLKPKARKTSATVVCNRARHGTYVDLFSTNTISNMVMEQTRVSGRRTTHADPLHPISNDQLLLCIICWSQTRLG